jgi:DNA-binding NtrC family response regulator
METLGNSQRPLSILHLEDDERDRLLIQDALREAGQACEFRNVASGDEFERALAGDRFDLVISDYSMPSYNGRAALEATRRADCEVPFLFVSGTIGEERAVESLRDGATDYVLKENLARLVPAVTRALREAEELRLRRLAENARQEAEARFREMADTIQDVFRVGAADGRRISYVNPACARVLGRSAAEIMSDPDPGGPAG